MLEYKLEVCVPGLVLVGTRLDGTMGHFPNSRDHDETTYLWYCSPGKFRKNSGKIRVLWHFLYSSSRSINTWAAKVAVVGKM